ncbi:MAG: RNA polymerase sigma factor [Acidimicrobiales bacterium]|nr:RNA polymerase sigma factor [Acidimicrobiales bacterium]
MNRQDLDVAAESDAALYRKHAAELTRYATMLVGPDDAADVVATAVMNCMSARSWPQVHNRRAYLYRATLHEARRSNRARWTRRNAEERATRLRRSTAFDVIDDGEVRRALQRLSIKQRGTVYLTYWEDLNPRDIGELLGISEGSVKRHLARARAQLREVLREFR